MKDRRKNNRHDSRKLRKEQVHSLLNKFFRNLQDEWKVEEKQISFKRRIR